MKELSIEQKAKRYDEAIKVAKNSLINSDFPGFIRADIIFPELKEFEDTRIRNALINYIKNEDYILNTFCGISTDEALTWLEKQSQTFTKKDVNDAYLRGICDAKQELEKQGEQRTVDKVEPKFKVGDWVVINNDHQSISQIEKIEDGYYILRHTHGGTIRVCVLHDKSLRLWTIQDAKDCDVLVCPKYAGDIIPNIFIFKDIKIKDNDVFCYCSFLDTFRIEGYVANADPINTDFYPATKEQRDILFKAMKDAGYEFDFDKKELKKIE